MKKFNQFSKRKKFPNLSHLHKNKSGYNFFFFFFFLGGGGGAKIGLPFIFFFGGGAKIGLALKGLTCVDSSRQIQSRVK